MRSRIAAITVCLTLVLAGCGARLTREQRLAGINAIGGGGGTTTTNGTATTGPGAINPTTGATTGPGGAAGPGAAGPGAAGPGAVACGSAGTNTASDAGVTPTQVTVATASDISGVQAGLFKSTHDAM